MSNADSPRLPVKFMLGVSFLIGVVFLYLNINRETLTSMLDFLTLIAPILFTAFGIWIGIIDPRSIFDRSKVIDSRDMQSNEASEQLENLSYKLCYFLMCCTFVIIAVIILEFLFLTYPAWIKILKYTPYENAIKSIMKFIATTAITFLFCIVAWVAFAILYPLNKTMNQHEQHVDDQRRLN